MKNYGGYIARFSLRYRLNGYWKVEYSEYFYYGQTYSMPLPRFAQSPYLIVENMVFIAMWRSVYEADVSAFDRICIKISGTTLHPFVQLNC